MRDFRATGPQRALLETTRGMLGVGLGLLFSDRLRRRQRATAGWVLAALGALTAIPVAIDRFRRRGRARDAHRDDGYAHAHAP